MGCGASARRVDEPVEFTAFDAIGANAPRGPEASWDCSKIEASLPPLNFKRRQRAHDHVEPPLPGVVGKIRSDQEKTRIGTWTSLTSDAQAAKAQADLSKASESGDEFAEATVRVIPSNGHMKKVASGTVLDSFQPPAAQASSSFRVPHSVNNGPDRKMHEQHVANIDSFLGKIEQYPKIFVTRVASRRKIAQLRAGHRLETPSEPSDKETFERLRRLQRRGWPISDS